MERCNHSQRCHRARETVNKFREIQDSTSRYLEEHPATTYDVVNSFHEISDEICTTVESLIDTVNELVITVNELSTNLNEVNTSLNVLLHEKEVTTFFARYRDLIRDFIDDTVCEELNDEWSSISQSLRKEERLLNRGHSVEDPLIDRVLKIVARYGISSRDWVLLRDITSNANATFHRPPTCEQVLIELAENKIPSEFMSSKDALIKIAQFERDVVKNKKRKAP
jgi:hypothetical protein